MDILGRGLLLIRTVRHLRPRQVAWRLLRGLRGTPPAVAGAVAFPRMEPAHVDTLAAAAAQLHGGWHENVVRLLAGELRIHQTSLPLAGIDWTADGDVPLLTYHLHYFDAAVDLAIAERELPGQGALPLLLHLMDGWIDATEDGRGRGWDPYPTSVRVLNWLVAVALLEDRLEPAARQRILRSLARQVSAIDGRTEYDLDGNHLLMNRLAIAAGALCLRGAGPAAGAVAALRAELGRQVPGDGLHYERSPMYHARLLRDVILFTHLARCAGADPDIADVARLVAMTRALRLLSRPDGTLHLFQDSAQDAAPGWPALAAAAAALPGFSLDEVVDGAFSLPDGRYFAFTADGERERFVIDAGAPAPRHQPGHAHCSALSFELDLFGVPLFVDAGVHGYDGDAYREYVRSTRAHNTVQVGESEQSEVWGTFRMGGRARVGGSAAATAGGWRFDGSCMPYHGAGAHERTVERLAPGRWRMSDRVTGASGLPVTSRLHVHPDWRVGSGPDGLILQHTTGHRVHLKISGADAVRVVRGERDPVQGWLCDRFGVTRAAATIEAVVHRNDGRHVTLELGAASVEE